jgi:hypothetical protein
MLSRQTAFAIVGGLALGTALATGWWRISVVPEEALNLKRHQSILDLSKLYGLQLAYKQAHGTYANDFASLLTVAPDAAALKASLAANVDMTTLTVVGDANKFKIELNVLDRDRTPFKVRGPITWRPPVRTAVPAGIATPAPPSNADGTPISDGH